MLYPPILTMPGPGPSFIPVYLSEISCGSCSSDSHEFHFLRIIPQIHSESFEAVGVAYFNRIADCPFRIDNFLADSHPFTCIRASQCGFGSRFLLLRDLGR